MMNMLGTTCQTKALVSLYQRLTEQKQKTNSTKLKNIMAKALTKDEAKTKVYELTKQLAEIRKEKKSANVDFKDRINDVENEIEAIIDEQEAQNTAGTTP
jgi:arginine/lysine/ornithine decarboxylase